MRTIPLIIGGSVGRPASIVMKTNAQMGWIGRGRAGLAGIGSSLTSTPAHAAAANGSRFRRFGGSGGTRRWRKQAERRKRTFDLAITIHETLLNFHASFLEHPESGIRSIEKGPV